MRQGLADKLRISRCWATLLRYPVAASFLAAFAVRSLFASALHIAGYKPGGRLSVDEAQYILMVAEWNLGGAATWDQDVLLLWDKVEGFTRPISWITRLFGQHILAHRLIPVVCGSLLVAAVTFVVSQTTSERRALASGLILALTPGQVLWSSLVLKDSFVWLDVALVVLCVHTACNHPRQFQRWVCVVGLALTVLHLGQLRAHSTMVVLLALFGAVLVVRPKLNPAWHIGTLGLFILAPLTFGGGWCGIHLFRQLAHRSAVQDAGAIEGTATATSADPGFLEGLRMLLVDPLPWHLTKSPNLIPIFVEHVLWLPLLFYGLRSLFALRKGPRSLAPTFTAIYVTGTSLMWGLVEGNTGTAYRHRGELVWAMVFLVATRSRDRGLTGR